MSAEEWPAKGCELYGHSYQGKRPCLACGAEYVELTGIEKRIAAAVKWDLFDEAGREQHAEEVGRKIAKSLKAAGYVIVELPQPNPNGVRRHPSWRVVVDGESEDVYVRRDSKTEPEIEVVVSGVSSLTVAESRSLAAALLAAAEAVSGE